MRHIVMFSGGIGSWAAAKRVAQAHGTDGMTLLFTDTLIEDADLYRFLGEAAANVGAPLVRIAEGRTPWQVFRDERFLGNSRADPCSRVLKRELAARWLRENCDPLSTTIYIGIDWSEAHRFDGARKRYAADGWRLEAPMCEPPHMTKRGMLAWLKADRIAAPRLYAMGFDHNNCGGGCVKAGQGHFAILLRELPQLYAEWEDREEEMRQFLGKDVAILTDRRGGERKPLTLRELRERIQAGQEIERDMIGGCGCFMEAA